jgi:putative transposase
LPELAKSAVPNLALLNESLLAWLEVVYHRKVHSETGQAPLERFRQDDAPNIRSVEPTELRQAFLHREQRTVTTTAAVSFHGNRYRVAAYLRRQKVELRYDPFDLTRIEVWFQDTFLQLAEPERVVTTTHPDVEPDPSSAPPSSTGLDYLALLRAERERLLQQQLQGIRFSQLQQDSDPDSPDKQTDDQQPQEEPDDDQPQ